MYRDREPGDASTLCNAARCRSRAGDRSTAPCPAAYASRFAAERVNRSWLRTGAREAPRSPASNCGPAAPRPSSSARPGRFAGEAARPPFPCIAFGCPHAWSVARRRSGAGTAAPQRRSATSMCASSSCATCFAGEVVCPLLLRTTADFVLPASASVYGFAGEAALPLPAAAVREVRPNSASEGRFGAEVVCPPLFGAVAGDRVPCSASEERFGAEGPGTPSCTAADGASPCSTSLCRSTSLPCARTTPSRTVAADDASSCGGVPFSWTGDR